jgi:hypothetical protein
VRQNQPETVKGLRCAAMKAHFRNCSSGNVLLIERQKLQLTYAADMWSWNQLRRRVKRGEKCIAILAHMIAKIRKGAPKEERNGEELPAIDHDTP